MATNINLLQELFFNTHLIGTPHEEVHEPMAVIKKLQRKTVNVLNSRTVKKCFLSPKCLPEQNETITSPQSSRRGCIC